MYLKQKRSLQDGGGKLQYGLIMLDEEDEKIPLASPDLITNNEASEPGKYIIYNPNPGKVYVINESAMKIIQMCDGTNTIGDISHHVRNAYDLNVDVDADVHEIIEEFHKKNLITFIQNKKSNPQKGHPW